MGDNPTYIWIPRQGTEVHGAKLNCNKVRDIKERFEAGETKEILAQEYRVGTACIMSVVRKESWRHCK